MSIPTQVPKIPIAPIGRHMHLAQQLSSFAITWKMYLYLYYFHISPWGYLQRICHSLVFSSQDCISIIIIIIIILMFYSSPSGPCGLVECRAPWMLQYSPGCLSWKVAYKGIATRATWSSKISVDREKDRGGLQTWQDLISPRGGEMERKVFFWGDSGMTLANF